MLLVTKKELQESKDVIARYKLGEFKSMTPELWHAKKVCDSTLHPDTGEPVLLPFRMSAFVLTNLVVTAGMLTPGLGVRLLFITTKFHFRTKIQLLTG